VSRPGCIPRIVDGTVLKRSKDGTRNGVLDSLSCILVDIGRPPVDLLRIQSKHGRIKGQGAQVGTQFAWMGSIAPVEVEKERSFVLWSNSLLGKIVIDCLKNQSTRSHIGGALGS